jgi:hypothetical protein
MSRIRIVGAGVSSRLMLDPDDESGLDSWPYTVIVAIIRG